MDVIIICVNYNSQDSLDKYLASIDNSLWEYRDIINLSVVISDNSTEVNKITKKYCFELIHIETGRNLGYFGGIAYAINNIRVDWFKFKYIILSNVDVFVEHSFFYNLLNYKLEKTIGCIAPKILSLSENRNRNPKVVKRYSLKRLIFFKIMYKMPVLYYVYVFISSKIKRKQSDITSVIDIYAAHGSFMIFSKNCVNFIRKLQYKPFLFGEELYVAENLYRLKLRTVYNPSIIVNDDDHVSTSKMKSSFYFKYNYEAIKYIIEEFY